MGKRQHDRRRNRREGACLQVELRSVEGGVLAEGLLMNHSVNGAFVVTRSGPMLGENERVIMEMKAPPAGEDEAAVSGPRLCRVVRSRQMGNLLGVGLEFAKEPQ